MNLVQRLASLATGRLIWMLVGLNLINLGFFQYYYSRINHLGGKSLIYPDTTFGYTPQELYGIFDAMTSNGRPLYAFMEGTVDMVFPIVYGALFFFLLIYTLTRKARLKSILSYLICLPLLAIGFDYVENINLIQLANSFPEMSEGKINFTSWMTKGKWMFLIGTLIAIITLLFIPSKQKPRRSSRGVGG